MASKKFLQVALCCMLSLSTANIHASTLQSQTSLTLYPLSQMKMVGTINNGEQIWGIVRTPDNHVYSVAVSNVIGNGQGRVLQVTSQRITIESNPAGQMNIETLWLSNE